MVKNFYTTTTRYNFINHNDGTFYYHVRACNNAGCSSDAVSPTIEVAKYLVLGEACDPTEGTPCASDVCADLGDGRFICCDRACDVEAGSCQLCGLDGVCGVQASGHECRPVAGDCDTADYCDGVSQACGDEVLPTIAVCRPAADACDAAERCDGVSASCPVEDRRLPIGTVCRRSRGACDSPEYCEGNPTSCTADVLYPVGFTCREAAGPNDIPEACDGTPDCPPENPNGRSPEFVCGVTL